MEADKPGNPKANDATSPPKKRDNTTSFIKIQKKSASSYNKMKVKSKKFNSVRPKQLSGFISEKQKN